MNTLTPLMPWQAWVYKKRQAYVHKWWDHKDLLKYVVRDKLGYYANRTMDGVNGDWLDWFSTRNVAYDPAIWGPNRTR